MNQSVFIHSPSKGRIESESRSVLFDSLQPHGLYNPWSSAGQNTGVGSLFLLQGIFPAQGLNLGLPHCTLRAGSLPAEPQGKPKGILVASQFLIMSKAVVFLACGSSYLGTIPGSVSAEGIQAEPGPSQEDVWERESRIARGPSEPSLRSSVVRAAASPTRSRGCPEAPAHPSLPVGSVSSPAALLRDCPWSASHAVCLILEGSALTNGGLGLHSPVKRKLEAEKDYVFDKRLRYSVRQNESNCRFRDIVVRKEEGFTHILLSSQTSDNNALTPEVRGAGRGWGWLSGPSTRRQTGPGDRFADLTTYVICLIFMIRDYSIPF